MKPFYGGQAVIEGVMMRGPRHYAVAVRDPAGRIVVHSELIKLGIAASRVARFPFIRGALVLWDTLKLGMQTLVFSADVAMGGEAEDQAIENSRKGTATVMWGSVIVALLIAAGIFFVIPVLITGAVDSYLSTPLLSNIVEKVIRLVMILGYIAAIGFMPDVKRVFGYHGAEHKTINAYEAGVDLTVANVRRFTLLHPRCGTTFLLVVVLVSFVFFALLGRPPMVERIISRVALIPVVAGVAYELIRLGATHYHLPLVRSIMAPGLAVQSLTTREPDDSMLEVAIASLKTVLAAERVATSV